MNIMGGVRNNKFKTKKRRKLKRNNNPFLKKKKNNKEVYYIAIQVAWILSSLDFIKHFKFVSLF